MPQTTKARILVSELMYLAPTRDVIRIKEKGDQILSLIENKQDNESCCIRFIVNGTVVFFLNKYKEGVDALTKAFDFAGEDPDLIGAIHFLSGLNKRSLGKLDEAVSHHFKAAELINGDGAFSIFLMGCYHHLGEIHISINEPEVAIDYLNKSLEVRGVVKDETTLFRAYYAMGNAYQNMKEYGQAEEYLKKAIQFNQVSQAMYARGLNDMGVLKLETGEYDQAKKYLSESLELREQQKLEDACSTTLLYLAEVNLRMNLVKEALDLLDRGKITIKKFHTQWKEMKLYHLLAQAYAANGNAPLSIDYYERFIALQNDVRNEQERRIFKFKNEQIEKQKAIISEKHNQLMQTFDEIKRLKIDRKATLFSWITVIVLVLLSEIFLDPFIDNHAYNNIFSIMTKVAIALLFKPLDGMYEQILWNKTIKKVA